MPHPTLLDFYRQDAERTMADKYTTVTLTGNDTLSNDEFLARVAALHAGLGAFGVRRGDRVAILSDNRAEWHQADLASLALRAVTVPIYPTLNGPQVGYHLRDSGATVVFTEGVGQTAKVVEGLGGAIGEVIVIQIGETPPGGVQSYDAVIQRYRSDDAVVRFWTRAHEVEPEDLATIVYTSGTTGQPKGAMLTHANISSNVLAVLPRTPLKASDEALEFLPLCHIFERTCGYAYMSLGVKRTYCPPALVSENIASVRPTAFASVPRLFEKIHSTIVTRVSEKSGFSQKLFNWSVETGREVARRRLAQEKVTGRLAMAHGVADRMVLGKIREAFGGRLRCALSGGAPLAPSLNEFFHAIGIPIQEAYGLTETSPGISANGHEPGQNRIGTVGRPLDGVQVAFTDDGELLVKGPGVTQGYWQKPEDTAESFTPEGFFRTGDIAALDNSGFLVITDRKKDIIIPAGGKNVAPQPIEQALAESPVVEHAVLIGDRRPYIVALLSPSEEALRSWAHTHGLGGVETADLLREPEVKAMFDEAVRSVNRHLGHHETVKKHRILPAPLTIESGHLTPTMKVKRRIVENDFSAIIEQMYAS